MQIHLPNIFLVNDVYGRRPVQLNTMSARISVPFSVMRVCSTCLLHSTCDKFDILTPVTKIDPCKITDCKVDRASTVRVLG